MSPQGLDSALRPPDLESSLAGWCHVATPAPLSQIAEGDAGTSVWVRLPSRMATNVMACNHANWLQPVLDVRGPNTEVLAGLCSSWRL